MWLAVSSRLVFNLTVIFFPFNGENTTESWPIEIGEVMRSDWGESSGFFFKLKFWFISPPPHCSCSVFLRACSCARAHVRLCARTRAGRERWAHHWPPCSLHIRTPWHHRLSGFTVVSTPGARGAAAVGASVSAAQRPSAHCPHPPKATTNSRRRRVTTVCFFFFFSFFLLLAPFESTVPTGGDAYGSFSRWVGENKPLQCC